MSFAGGPTILKRSITEVDHPSDLIILNHTLEHIRDPDEVFECSARLLRPDGWLVVRTPVASSLAFRTYGADWVQLDAPRHLIIHTPESISMLAGRAGFDVLSIQFDSTGFQFWGSELYKRNISLVAAMPVRTMIRRSLFTKEAMRRFEFAAKALNKAGKGDQACFLLQRHK